MAWARTRGFSNYTEMDGGTYASVAIALGGAVAVGDKILVGVCVAHDTDLLAPTMADQLGNLYHKAKHVWDSNVSDLDGLDAYWCVVEHAGTPTITFTPNPGGTDYAYLAIWGDHLTGGDSGSTIDGAAAGQMQDTSGLAEPPDNVSTGNNAPTVDGDLQWATAIDFSSDGIINKGSAFTEGLHADGGGSSAETEWRTLADHAAAPGLFGSSGGSQRIACIAISLTAAALGPAPIPGRVNRSVPFSLLAA